MCKLNVKSNSKNYKHRNDVNVWKNYNFPNLMKSNMKQNYNCLFLSSKEVEKLYFAKNFAVLKQKNYNFWKNHLEN